MRRHLRARVRFLLAAVLDVFTCAERWMVDGGEDP